MFLQWIHLPWVQQTPELWARRGCHASRRTNFHTLLHGCQKGEEKNPAGLSTRFSLIVLQVSLDSDFQCMPEVSKIQMCEYFILLISLASPKNFGLSWIILSHCVMRSISFSQQNEKLSQKNWKQINSECLAQKHT